MGLFSRLQIFEKKYALTFFGVLVGIIFGGFTVYTAYFQNKPPHIRYEILSKANVYDIHEKLPKLDIIYDGVNIREKGETLTLITFRVVNKGTQPVLKTFYDDRAPLGFELQGGTIIKSELLSASSGYLASNTVIQSRSPVQATFPDVIIDPDAWFSVKVLILHDETLSPEIKPIGVIAGARPNEPEVVVLWKPEIPQSFLKQTLGGELRIQAVRSLVYTLLFILFIILALIVIIPPISFIRSRIGKANRRRDIQDFRAMTDIALSKNDEVIFKWYLERGWKGLSYVEILLSGEHLKTYMKMLNRLEQGRKAVMLLDRETGLPLMRDLKESGFVSFDGKIVSVNDHMRGVFAKFRKFLTARRKKKSGSEVDANFEMT